MSGWQHTETLGWHEPLDVAAQFAHEDIALLYSGLRESFTGAISYLCVRPIETIEGASWHALPPLPDVPADGLPRWIGYLSYEMGEDVPPTAPGPIALPNFRLVRYAAMWRFDHTSRVVECFVQNDEPLTTHHAPRTTHHAPPITSLTSNLTRASYASAVADTIARIHAGDFYQANLTRKFHGTFDTPPDSWEIFRRLTAASPAPYSAYIRHGGTAILSASPECFVSVDAAGSITTRPIKGSARRGDSPAEDDAIRAALATSEKNHAENLMIVDLMRNDLARVSTPQSVEVIEQSALYSYATIHHLISTIRAHKRADASVYEVIRACFPPGSMTGAPKIAAMRWCAAHEGMARGVYSGAIGWFGAGGTCDFSVTIRTLILNHDRFEFQVGGGIVADSTPEDEWHETLIKARGICRALGLSEADLAAL